jgi:hypothetical protein
VTCRQIDPDDTTPAGLALCLGCGGWFPEAEAYDATGEFGSEACLDRWEDEHGDDEPAEDPEREARLVACRDCTDPIDPIEHPTHTCASCIRIREYAGRARPAHRGYQLTLRIPGGRP